GGVRRVEQTPRDNRIGISRRLREIFFSLGRYGTTMRVYVVDNGGQWTHREWRVLKYLGADTKIVAKDTPVSELDGLDGLVLSGGAPRGGGGSGKVGRD